MRRRELPALCRPALEPPRAAWAAILAVPTAIAGIYGMNFEHMPELKWRYGYFLVIAVIAAVCSSLIGASTVTAGFDCRLGPERRLLTDDLALVRGTRPGAVAVVLELASACKRSETNLCQSTPTSVPSNPMLADSMFRSQGPDRMWFADLPSACIAPSDSTCGPSIASNPCMLTVKHQG